MTAFAFTTITELLATAALDLSSADIRVICLMSDTTADVEEDAANIDDITTLDEFDGVGYTELDLASITVTQVTASDRTEVDAASGTFGATVAAGTRYITAILYYLYIDGTAANDIPLVYDDTSSTFPLQADGGPLNISLDPTGFLHIAA